MRFFTRELMTLTGGLVIAYLVLAHYTGFSRDVQATSQLYTSSVKALQGR